MTWPARVLNRVTSHHADTTLFANLSDYRTTLALLDKEVDAIDYALLIIPV